MLKTLKTTGVERCMYCDYSSGFLARIVMHIITNHAERLTRMDCPFCAQRFQRKFKFHGHLITHVIKKVSTKVL